MSQDIDKSWINKPRNTEAYIKGVCDFMEFAKKGSRNEKIRCPCNKCQVDRKKLLSLEDVERHIFFKGFYKEYKDWIFHGPKSVAENVCNQIGLPFEVPNDSEVIGNDDISGLLRDAFMVNIPSDPELLSEHNDDMGVDDTIEESSEESSVQYDSDEFLSQESNMDYSYEEVKYSRLHETSSKPLYDGCTSFSKLSFLLHLFHLKCMFKWPDKSFSMLIDLLLDAFPQIKEFPSSYYQAKKLIMDLGLGYEKIHACPNNCTLYWGEFAENDHCPQCSTSRWKKKEGKIPAKVMRYFPLIPRLRRMFMSSKISKDIRWHDEGRINDGILRHPADGLAWKNFNNLYPEFAKDARSVRLGLPSDGFNPYRLMNTTYSTWPIVLITYNLPPWSCMKPSSFILSSLIPGHEGPGNNIDTYMAPLIHELNLLWKGVSAFDSYTGEKFKLQATLMWTINDFPAYGMLSAWSTKGYNACPECNYSTPSTRVGNRICYVGHRKWLPSDHPFRFQMNLFDGTEEHDNAPLPMAASDVLREQQSLNYKHGKVHKSLRKRHQQSLGDNDVNDVDDANDINNVENLWNKKSIFFDLPYWEHNTLRHNLDVMHIEKNVCDNVLGTLMNVDGKSKDDEYARIYVEERNVKSKFWLECNAQGEVCMPIAPYCMSPEIKESFLQVLTDLKFPDGYGSNISRCVKMKKKWLVNLKSHDNHILMQDILPVALKASRASKVVDLIDDLSTFFNSLCAKYINSNHLDALQSKIVQVLCQMEIEFLPPFFTISVHLLIHLVNEVKLGGPVHYRWMYPIERYLAHLKTFVRNKAQPEGSISEGYILEETITFCSRYLEGVETVFNRQRRNDDDNDANSSSYWFNSCGRTIGQVKVITLPNKSKVQIHRYVLTQFQELIQPFEQEFLSQKARENPRISITDEVMNKWKLEEFPDWFKLQVQKIDETNAEGRMLIALASGPSSYAKRMKGHVINGFKFNTLASERFRKTQNSGVMVEADGNTYYGRLTDILEVDYLGSYKIVVYRCDWVDLVNGMEVCGFRCRVNFSKLIHTGRLLNDEPFIISSQAKQVFYVDDKSKKGWSFVVETKPRDLFDLS